MVGIKLNTNIKYINKASDYYLNVKKEIPKEVFQRLIKLTTITEERISMKIECLYLKNIETDRGNTNFWRN